MRVVNAFGAAGLLLDLAVAISPVQQVLNNGQGSIAKTVDAPKKRPLYGRFLHITDFHPDSFYEVYSSTAKDSACHRGQGPAGIYGAETSECDSPLALINKTMDWVREQFRDSVDFVLWTGDSARHDSDDEHPRSKKEILDLNRFMVNRMLHAFGKENGDEEDEDPNNDFVIPVIPTFGNNDIMPHNIMSKGPNTWTRTYTDVWRQFLPEVQKHQFEQGGWFFVEVIPNKLAVFSLNTMYFFSSNAAVDGCAEHSEPGYRQLEWLRIQLQFLRDRGMKAILIGHVPPVRQEVKSLFDETCWQKYALWLRQYRDVIVSSMYGHFNYDHFILQDFHDIDDDTENGAIGNYRAYGAGDDDVNAKLSSSYFIQLRDDWADLPNPPKGLSHPTQAFSLLESIASWLPSSLIPDSVVRKGKKNKDKKKQHQRYLKKIGGPYAERFAASFISASVVPNLYPTLRIFEYNITGLDSEGIDPILPSPPPDEYDTEDIDSIDTLRKKKHRKYKFTIPHPPSRSAPPGPAYSPQTFSLLRYTQYWANLTHINNDFTHKDEELEDEKWREGKHKGKKPHDKDHKPNPKPFKFDVYYDTKDDDVYQLEDLTMPNLLGLARRIGQFVSDDSVAEENSPATDDSDDFEDEKKKKKKKKGKKHHKGKHEKDNLPWYTFVSRAFVQTMSPKEIRDEFGH